MSMSKPNVLPLVGLPQVDGWAQVVETGSSYATTVCTISVSGSAAQRVGKELSRQIQSVQVSTAEQLFNLINDLDQLATAQKTTLAVSCILRTPNRTTIASLRGGVYLVRKDKAAHLIRSAAAVQLIEGKMYPEDIYMVATAEASKYFEEVTQRMKQGYDVQSAAASVASAIQGFADASLSALALVTMRELELEDSAEVSSPVVEQPKASAAVIMSGAKRQDLVTSKPKTPEDRYALRDIPPQQPVEQQSSTPEPSSEELQKTEPSVEEQDSQAAPEIQASEHTNPGAVVQLGSIISTVGAGIWAGVRELTHIIQQSVHKQPDSTQRESTESVEKPLVLDEPTATVEASSQPNTESIGHTSKSDIPKRTTTVTTGDQEDVDRLRSLSQDFLDDADESSIDTGRTRSKKLLTKIIGVAFIVLSLATAGFVVWYFQRQSQVAAAAEQLQPLSEQLESINTRSKENPIEMRSELVQLIAQIETLQQEFADQAASTELIQAELTAARELLTQLSGREELVELPLLYDLRLAQDTFVASHTTYTANQGIFFDQQLQQLILFSLETQQTRSVPLSGLNAVTDIIASEDTLYMLAEDGVYSVDLSVDEPTASLVIDDADSLTQAQIINAFATFVYVLNPQTRSLYRFSESGGAFGDPSQWLQSPLGVSFDSVVSMAIDGDVWIGTNTGQVKQFASGSDQEFAIAGISTPLSSMTQLTTSPDLQSLYILDSEENRLLVVTKDGQFLKEYKTVTLGGVSAIIPSEELGKIFAVSGSSVYEITL